MFGFARKLIFGISADDTTFARRGFVCSDPAARQRLERIGQVFVEGYHAALADPQPAVLALQLDQADLEVRGFAYEGAAMALALLDRLTPWRRNRWETFLAGPGQPHIYMLHVGLGWVFARLPLVFTLPRVFPRLDPVLRWLTLDGYGFHEGFFRAPGGARLRRAFHPYAPHAFDHGLGRSLWFSQCAEPERISKMIMAFDLHRQADLWSGVGLACGYAGDLPENGLRLLLQRAGESSPQLAQGVAFAAKARQRAGNLMPFTELACRIICGMSAEDAAHVTDEALENLPLEAAQPAYEIWRQRIQQRLNQPKEMKR